ncbi:hypothetical protein ABLE93_20640 [Xanthobacter sp. KR7-65]|uniref:hypothetical protein n=1 Tax=Xanthobacter sp. KR7-65 TaxID=3156612 RepID=UPI0032B4DC4C
MYSTTIHLVKPLLTHGGPVSVLVLSEPTGRDYLRLGEPVVWGRNPDGTVFTAENEEVIRGYIDASLPDSVDSFVIDQACLEDAMNIKAAVLDFFRAAQGRRSAQSSTTSSSTPE